MKDPIERQDAINRITRQYKYTNGGNDRYAVGINVGITKSLNVLKDMPSAGPEDSIPISWIEKEIDWLNNTDNCFANLTATNISAMVKRWKEEKDG